MKMTLGDGSERVENRVAALVSAGAADRIWRRDATFWGDDPARLASVSNRLGWLDVAWRMRERAGEIEGFDRRMQADGFRDAVLCGMGGSSLAPEVLRQSFGRREGWPALHVLDTTDPATIGAVVAQIDVARTLFFVSSKSGTTIEPNALFAYFHELVQAKKGERAGENFVAITDAGTPLEALAQEHKFRHVFTNPPDIGGRYSALSFFGLVPAAVMGIDVAMLLDRGIAAAEAAKAPDSDALRLGAALAELAIAGRDKCTFLVAPKIASFGLWVEQLIAESTGKLGKGILPVAGEPIGTPKQYGDDRVFVQLRLDADSNDENDAAIGALSGEGFPTIVIDLDDVYDIGREFFRWEYAIAVAGQVLAINPFDEPNVQESKDNTNRVLKEFEQSGKLELDAIGANDLELRPAVQQLAGLRAPEYFAITAYIQPTAHSDEEFAHIRSTVRDRCHVATTLGYGPRFLHSTGQLHKGGPPNGVFLQVIGDYGPDIAIPGKPFTFGQLKRAQAIGDRESLLSHGLRVVTIDIRGDWMNLESVCQDITEFVGDVAVIESN